ARASPRQPPTVLGAQPATFDDKRQWILDHLEGFVWPGADTERLRDAAQTWRTAADGVTDLTTYCDVVVDHLAAQESPEIPLALAALDELRSLVESTSGDLAAIAGACDGYAAQVEDTHARLHALLDEILQMVVEGIVISVAIGVITGGAGAAAGGAATVARVAAQSPRFHAIISALRAAAAPTTQAVRTTRETLRATRFRLEKFTHARARMRTERGAIVLPSGRVFRSIGGRGWLRAHEHSGSHTITRHVGKSDDYLRDRMLKEGLDEVSTFVDERTAERVIADALRSRHAVVEQWLGSGKKKLEFDFPASSQIGRTMNETGALVPPSKVRVVLALDPGMRDGFRLLTSFPKP
ncbi:MAG TPA: RNase A-like domain-containing protein, partial [Actinomycetes bacterium]|nr:RNase A-like domain-containing protein [Actinomycetes bacterium]